MKDIHTSWRYLGKSDIPFLKKFLCERESWCTSFSSRLIKKNNLVLPEFFDGAVIGKSESNNEITSALLVVSDGVWFPIFGSSIENNDRQIIKHLLKKRRYTIFTCMGLEDDLEKLTGILEARSVDSIKYHYMNTTNLEFPVHSPKIEGLKCRKAIGSDFYRLSNLQAAYEVEEVVRPNKEFNRAICDGYLASSLKKEIVVVAEYEGTMIAKAQTNAKGFSCYQIGGVYVMPEFRNRGIAECLMENLLSIIAREKKTASLFVKKSNFPAIALYKKLGFRIFGDFRIDYFY